MIVQHHEEERLPRFYALPSVLVLLALTLGPLAQAAQAGNRIDGYVTYMGPGAFGYAVGATVDVINSAGLVAHRAYSGPGGYFEAPVGSGHYSLRATYSYQGCTWVGATPTCASFQFSTGQSARCNVVVRPPPSGCAPTPTNTPTRTRTRTPTITATPLTPTRTRTPSSTPTATLRFTNTATPTNTPRPTSTPRPPIAPPVWRDARADLTVWRPGTGMWLQLNSEALPCMNPPNFRADPSDTRICTRQWGLITDVPVAADYDGDRDKDVAVWRPSTGEWLLLPSSRSCPRGTSPWTVPGSCVRQWGSPGDVTVPADYDGDGRDDIAIWRPSNATWQIIPSTGNCPPRTGRGFADSCTRQWGNTGQIPVPADYDADGLADIGILIPASSTWSVLPTRQPFGCQPGWTYEPVYAQCVVQWGLPDDISVPSDYDGDGRTDAGVWRPTEGSWYVSPSGRVCPPTMTSAGPGTCVRQWGLSGDEPVPADYDGDGRNDLGVWRPSSGDWFLFTTTRTCPLHTSALPWESGMCVRQFGLNGDIPTPW